MQKLTHNERRGKTPPIEEVIPTVYPHHPLRLVKIDTIRYAPF
jgi:hypothetical protein